MNNVKKIPLLLVGCIFAFNHDSGCRRRCPDCDRRHHGPGRGRKRRCRPERDRDCGQHCDQPHAQRHDKLRRRVHDHSVAAGQIRRDGRSPRFQQSIDQGDPGIGRDEADAKRQAQGRRRDRDRRGHLRSAADRNDQIRNRRSSDADRGAEPSAHQPHLRRTA